MIPANDQRQHRRLGLLQCALRRCAVVLRIGLALSSLILLITVGGSEDTVVNCTVLGLCVGLGVGAAFGVWSLLIAVKHWCHPIADPSGHIWQYFLHLLCVWAGVFTFFAFVNLAPIFLVQTLACLAAASFALTVGSVLLRTWWSLALVPYWAERFGLLVSIAAWSFAYVVLLLHREVNDHFAGLSARLSREEHLVLFSFGGFLISAAAWFLALLLPCGRCALQGRKVEVKEESISRYPSKEEPVQDEAALEVDTVVEINDVPEEVEESDADARELSLSEDFQDSTVQPLHPVSPSDLPGEVSPTSEEEKQVAKPLSGGSTAAPFPFPRGPSRPRRREEAWGSPTRGRVQGTGLSAVPEGDEDTVEGELQEVSPVPRWNIQAFLSNAGPARPLEACSEESEISEEVFETAAAPPEAAEAACLPEADSPHGLPSPCEDLPVSVVETASPVARLSQSEARKRHWRKVLQAPQALGLADISLADVGRAAVVSLAAHACAGLILLLGGYIFVVVLALLSVRVFFLLAAWLDQVQLSDPETCQVVAEQAELSPEMSVASTSPSSSPLAKVPEAYAASWGFFPPDRPNDGPDAERLGAMPSVQEEPSDMRVELGSGHIGETAVDLVAGASVPTDQIDQGADALRKTAQHAERPGGARPGRRRPGPEAQPGIDDNLPGESLQQDLDRPQAWQEGLQDLQESRLGFIRETPQPGLPHFPSPSPQSHTWNEIIGSTDSSTDRGQGFLALAHDESNLMKQSLDRLRSSRWVAVAAGMGTALALALLSILHALLLFFVFVFDLVFIEKYAVSGLSRQFILAAVNATCLDSQRLTSLGSFGPSECARQVMRSTSHSAFSMGPLGDHGARACYPQDGISEASFIDVFYGGEKAFCPWMPSPGFDFYVIEKQQPCSVLGRGTSLIVSNATAFSHRISDDLPDALASRCSSCSSVVQSILDVARALLRADVVLHQLLSAATPGFHRLGAAAFALGAAAAILLLVLLDVFFLLALGRKATALRLGVPLLHYAAANVLGQVLEKLVILLLHCVLMAGMSFQLELAHDFWPELHCTRSKQLVEGEHNAWHQTVHWTGTALVFFAAAISLILAAALLGGCTYRSHNVLPRWALSMACPHDAKLSRFTAGPASECRHEILAVDPEVCGFKALIRPLLGALASLGMWHRSTSVAFQVVKRQDWYLPSMPDDSIGYVFPSDCVSWMSVASATVNSLSISWLLLPYGALPARASLYLNECILCAAGTDGGNSADEPDQLASHVFEDTDPALHLARWAAACGQLVTLLLLLAVDFFNAEKRERLIFQLLLAGAFLSALRAIMALLQGITCFLRRRGLVFACCKLLQESLPARVVQSYTRAQQKTIPRSRSEEEADALGIQPWRAGRFFGKACDRATARVPLRSSPEREEDCLFGLTIHERKRVLVACRDLLQLDWVKSAHLPGHIRGKLAAARSSRSRRVRLAEALRGRQVATGWLCGAFLLALREVAEEDLCAQKCAVEAKLVASKHLRQHCTLQAARLQNWLQAHAKSQAARWASALWNSGAVGDILEASGQEQEAMSFEEEGWGKIVHEDDKDNALEEAKQQSTRATEKSDGFSAQSLSCASAMAMRSSPWKATDAPQSLRMLFAVTQQGLVRISGHWAAGGREILPEQQASINITAQAEVVLHWPRNGVSSSDVQVEFISHQIWPSLPPKDAQSGSPMTKRNERHQKSVCRRRLGTSWAQRKELQWEHRRWAGCCTKAPAAAEDDRMDSLWRVQCCVEWGEDAKVSECDSDKDAVQLFTELGCLSWVPPVALPALDPSQKLRPKTMDSCMAESSTRSSQLSQLGGRVAALVGGGPAGLLGPVAKVPQQDPARLPEELCLAAEAAAWTAASAAAVTPKVTMQKLEVALRWNPQQLPAAFFGALYAGVGGLTQAELRRQSWLTAAAARKMRRMHQAQLRSAMMAAGKCSESLLFWTACRERKRWLRNSERGRMGLTFLGLKAADGKLPQAGDAAAEMDVAEGLGLWHDPVSPHRTRSQSRRSSEGSITDQVTAFSRPSTPPVIVTEVDGPDGSDAPAGGAHWRSLCNSSPVLGEGPTHKFKEFMDKAAKDPDVSELAKALEEARQGAVPPSDLLKMEQCFEQLMTLERAALGLLEAVQSGSIRQLASRLSMARELGLENGAFPDATGTGVVQLATDKLEEEKAAVPLRLGAALQAFARKDNNILGVGVIALQRCIDQARAAEIQDHAKIYRVEAKLHLLCERKREIALLKAAMAVEDAWLLKAATEECRQRFGDSFGVDLTLAKYQLEIWEKAQEDAPAPPQDRRPSWLRLETQPRSHPERADVPPLGPVSVEEKAKAALRAVMFYQPPQAELLRLAIARARRVGVESEQAEQLLQEEREVERALEQLRRASAARDVRALRRAIADCTDVGVDQRVLMPATSQLCEAVSELLRRAHQHGLSLAILNELDRERQEVRCALAETQCGLRSICRVRPPLAQELREAWRMNAGLAPVLRRVDRRTLEVTLDGSYVTCDFSAVLGPESTQAETYGELTGFAQAALDGRDVAIMACGAGPGAGTSYTLCGTAEQPGVVPRLLEELFAMKDRELWRSEIHFDVQALEFVEDKPPTDLLTPDGCFLEQIHAKRPCYSQGQGMFAPVQLEGAATRRAAKVQEVKDLAEEIWQAPCHADRQAVLILHIRRTNRHTGVMIRSRLVVADLAGKRPAVLDRTVSQAIATSVALRRKSSGIAMSTWSATAAPEAAPQGSGSQVLTTLLLDCFNADRARIALVICLPPTAPDREKVLSVLEALGLRQSWVQTAETRAEKRFQAPPQPIELPGIPKLPPSPVLLQMTSSPASSPKNSGTTTFAFESKLAEEDL
ncbi:unnamed protein product [Durusdinium trenchii]|uniref:Kinesin motor domain-containing protein n=1 Tax=Durusdinium trenchii TaxID=1381693 RepID=A0ABP0N5U6_9DINO